ncbi:MAG: nucleotidyltransferase [Owenweeksia sp.]|nr:nucleotidyltransferase [Owenweeksia sp.]
MTLEELRVSNWIVMECISGSKAYGLDTPESDTDIKGVFVLPKHEFYGLDYLEQVSNPSNDIVFYELKRFVELLAKNNPNILELLATPDDSVIIKHSLLAELKPDLFLSRLCLQSFGNYAMAQIRKARGLNKKILNPMERKRRDVLDFCYIIEGQGSVPLRDFLESKGWKQEQCGLSKIPHMHEVYGLYHEKDLGFEGIISSGRANSVKLSSIPKELCPKAILSFNQSGYSKYCKVYKEYWDWVENRNDVRYRNTEAHGKNYDAKNMMHTFRLLAMAEEIARDGALNVRRPDRDFLLGIKHGEFSYKELVRQAEEKMEMLIHLYDKSKLPERPNERKIGKILRDLRAGFYSS